MDPFSLRSKRALVTGGSRGIGLGISRGLAQAGADLILVARGMAGLEDARQELAPLGRRVDVRAFDLEKTADIPGFYEDLIRETGPVDILVNNAGIARRGPAEGLALADWRRVLEVNLTAVFTLSQAFARERIASSRRGKVILIASLMSEAARRTNAPYAASKGGIRQLTKALAVDWATSGIHVNAIGPGYIRTDLTRPLQEDGPLNQWVLDRTPLGRWGLPADLAGAAVFLASAASDFITGQVIYVDGGWLAML